MQQPQPLLSKSNSQLRSYNLPSPQISTKKSTPSLPPVSMNNNNNRQLSPQKPTTLTRKRSVSFGKEHIHHFDKSDPPDHVISQINVGSKSAYTSTTITQNKSNKSNHRNIYDYPVDAKELTTRLSAIYLI